MNQKLAEKEPLTEVEQADLKTIKDFMDDPHPCGSAHPGWSNLTPAEQELF